MLVQLWQSIVGIGIGLSVAALLTRIYCNFGQTWVLPFRIGRRSRQSITRALEYLFRTLSMADTWHSSIDTESMLEIRRHLAEVKWKVWLEFLSYRILRSKDPEELCLALRNLSQTEGEASINHVTKLIQGVLDDKIGAHTSEVRTLAEMCLKELQELSKSPPIDFKIPEIETYKQHNVAVSAGNVQDKLVCQLFHGETIRRDSSMSDATQFKLNFAEDVSQEKITAFLLLLNQASIHLGGGELTLVEEGKVHD